MTAPANEPDATERPRPTGGPDRAWTTPSVTRHQDGDGDRSLHFELAVPGTPEQVWEAIATGPGVSSWYVPHRIEPHQDGEAVARFGPGPEMEVPGRVAAWEPPERVVFDGGEGVDGLAFEWLVEARDEATCIVRLVNRGFGAPGSQWDDYHDGMADGWLLFLTNLGLHLQHFAGRAAVSSLPGATWPGPRAEAWGRLLDGVGLTGSSTVGQPPVGDTVIVAADGVPPIEGTVVDCSDWRIAILHGGSTDPGTTFLACEGRPDAEQIAVSVWSYFYGPDAERAAADHQDRWGRWLEANVESTSG